jgi:hypothetical protein
LLVAADRSQRVLFSGSDELPGPRLTPIEGDALEQSYRARFRQRRHRYDVGRIGGIDGDGVFGLISRSEADIDVLENLSGGGIAG